MIFEKKMHQKPKSFAVKKQMCSDEYLGGLDKKVSSVI